MAFHQIQCPHCFTDYTISDEQYRNTEGVVRCGTCREQFKAILITEGGAPPKFDPRDVFIEPLSEPLVAAEGGDKKLTGEPDASYFSYKKQPDADEDSNIELMSTHEFEYTGPPEPPVPEDIVEAYGDSNELSTAEILRNLRERQGNAGIEPNVADADQTTSNQQGQQQLDLTIPEKAEGETLRQAPTLTRQTPDQNAVPKPASSDDVSLIDQVDDLVDKKLVAANPSTVTGAVKSAMADDMFLEPRKQKHHKQGLLARVLKSLFWAVVVLLLIGALVYQLWLKQFISLPLDHPQVKQLAQASEPVVKRVEQQLAEYDVAIPKRRNLSKLDLLSAKTEPHPTRSTTVLLKVSLINRADIAQPLPWLEMTLTDASGRLVSRRNLSPKDYIYNNRTSAQIGPNELKKVTIELLSFPKSATGFEVRLLNK